MSPLQVCISWGLGWHTDSSFSGDISSFLSGGSTDVPSSSVSLMGGRRYHFLRFRGLEIQRSSGEVTPVSSSSLWEVSNHHRMLVSFPTLLNKSGIVSVQWEIFVKDKLTNFIPYFKWWRLCVLQLGEWGFGDNWVANIKLYSLNITRLVHCWTGPSSFLLGTSIGSHWGCWTAELR